MPQDNQLEQHLLRQLQQAQANWQTRRFYVAFSGGADSTALLLACAAVRDALQPGTRITALHVHHGLQAAADDWLQHCQQVCDAHAIELRFSHVQLARRGNVEANARRQRYAFFTQQLQLHDCVLLAHHQHDQLETLLQRLFSGRGWLPMRTSAELAGGHLMRPLLNCHPQTLRAYLESRQQNWIEDPSNSDTTLQRNYLRHRILPDLFKHWPRLPQSLQRVAVQTEATQQALQWTLHSVGNQFDQALLPAQPDAAVAWLRAYLHSRNYSSAPDRALAEFLRQAAQGSAELSIKGGAHLYSYQQQIYFEQQQASPPAAVALDLGSSLECSYGRLQLLPASADTKLAMPYCGPLQVRVRQGGERLQTADRGSVTLKQLLQEARVPPWRRKHYPLLYADERLVCVPGIAVQAQALPAAGQCCVAKWWPV